MLNWCLHPWRCELRYLALLRLLIWAGWNGCPLTSGRTPAVHESSRLLRFWMDWICDILVGGGASVSPFVSTCKPLIIFSSAEGVGMVLNACRNSTVSDMTWLLMSLLTI